MHTAPALFPHRSVARLVNVPQAAAQHCFAPGRDVGISKRPILKAQYKDIRTFTIRYHIMKIGIVGGTGGMGRGFAMRWCRNHDVLVGSRNAERAAEKALEYQNDAKEAYGNDIKGAISGSDNVSIASKSDVLLLSIPYENIDSTCPDVLSVIKDDCIVVSPIVPMEKTSVGFEFVPFRDNKQSAHQMVQNHMKRPEQVVSAFHVISEKKLANPKMELDYDIFVCGDDKNAINTVNSLINEIDGLRPLHMGGSALAYMVEISTPILLNIMIKNKIKNPGIKIV